MSTHQGGKMRRILRTTGKIAAAVGALFVGAAVWASVTEPRALVGQPHDEAVRAYAAAEAHLFEHFAPNAQSRTLTLRDPAIRVHVMEVPGDGPPIVLIHGGGSSLVSWIPILSYLRDRHVFLVDRPGCGQTDGFDYVDVDLRKHAVAFIDGVLDQLHVTRAALVGNSMG